VVIVCSKIGQLGNRLTHMANIAANAIAYDYKVFYPYFENYQAFFEDFDGCLKTKLFSNKKLNSTLSIYLSIYLSEIVSKFRIKRLICLYRNYADDWKDNYDMNTPAFVNDAKHKIVLLQGWLFRDYIHVKEYREMIVNMFRPKQWIVFEVDEVVRNARLNSDILVGIHIRRGDYKTYNDGKYYYEDSVYAQRMKEFVNLQDNKRVKFFVCSNEDIKNDVFSDLDVCIKSRHFMVDLYALAQCDYIIGPPSSFTNWASYCGNVPLLKLFDKEQMIDIDKFEIRDCI
jgi:hypothetical protein